MGSWPRFASINDLPILESERKYHWSLGRRPDDQPGIERPRLPVPSQRKTRAFPNNRLCISGKHTAIIAGAWPCAPAAKARCCEHSSAVLKLCQNPFN